MDMDIAKFFDHVNGDILMGKIAAVVRDKRVLRRIGRYLRAGPWGKAWWSRAWKERRKAGRCRHWWGYYRLAENRRPITGWRDGYGATSGHAFG